MVNKEKTKRQKEIIYPILYECSKIQTDDFWKKIFDDLSRGKTFKGIQIYNGVISSTYKRNGFQYSISNITDHEFLSNELIKLFKEYAYIYSNTDIENKGSDFKEAEQDYINAKSLDSWKKLKTKNIKMNLLLNYVLHMKKKYKLNNTRANEFFSSLKDAIFEYKTHYPEDIIIDQGKIVDIKDFAYNKDLKIFINTRFEDLDDRITETQTKDILGNKWEKYIQTIVKIIAKEE